MRYSVHVAFHVEAPNKDVAEWQVNGALDLLFGMHWRDLPSVPGTYVHNASITHSKLALATQEA